MKSAKEWLKAIYASQACADGLLPDDKPIPLEVVVSEIQADALSDRFDQTCGFCGRRIALKPRTDAEPS